MRTEVHPAYDPADVASRTVALVVALAHGLRAAGFPVSTGETLDAVRALNAVGPRNRSVVRCALRTAMVKEDIPDAVFDRLFDLLFPKWSEPWRPAPETVTRADADLRGSLVEALRRGDEGEVAVLLDDAVRQWAGLEGPAGGERHHLQRVLRRLDLGALLHRVAAGEDDRSALERHLDVAEAVDRLEEVRRMLERLVAERMADAPGVQPAGTDLADRHILLAGPDEIAALRAAVRPLARRLATRLGRRRRRGRGRLDMRRTMRLSMSAGGVPLDPQLRRRSPTRPDLIVLCDVSGSIAQFAPFALALVHALHAEFNRVRSWVFVDGIVEITDVVAAAPGVLDAHRLLGRHGLVAGDGRSDYSRAFGSFLTTWGEVTTGKTTVLVVGDARSHDRPPALPQTAELARLARRLYWLNPEPAREWDTGDSLMSRYERYCTQVFEVSTLRQLTACVEAIA